LETCKFISIRTKKKTERVGESHLRKRKKEITTKIGRMKYIPKRKKLSETTGTSYFNQQSVQLYRKKRLEKKQGRFPLLQVRLPPDFEQEKGSINPENFAPGEGGRQATLALPPVSVSLKGTRP